jgi:hypothetical protein
MPESEKSSREQRLEDQALFFEVILDRRSHAFLPTGMDLPLSLEGTLIFNTSTPGWRVTLDFRALTLILKMNLMRSTLFGVEKQVEKMRFNSDESFKE